MKNTTKIIILIIALIVLLVFISFRNLGFATAEQTSEYTHSWTKAICNETACQDYEIYCNGDEFVSQSPITGAVISIPKGWEDPRNETMRERLCN